MKPVNIDVLTALAVDETVMGRMAAEIIESRAEIVRLRAIVDTPIKLPKIKAVYYLDANDNFNPYAYLWDLYKNIKEHGLKVAKDE